MGYTRDVAEQGMSEDRRHRLRGNFADVLARQAEELQELAGAAAMDPDVADALAFELERIRGTATVLGLGDVVAAATQAGDTLRRGLPVAAIVQFIDACRRMEDAEGLFNPIVLVGIELPTSHAYAWIVRSMPDVASAIARGTTTAAWVVGEDLAAGLATAAAEAGLRVPMYVVGPRHDFERRLVAARMGAAGYLSEPLDIGALLARVRVHDHGLEMLPSRVLLVEADARTARLMRGALTAKDCLVQRIADGAELLQALDVFWPDIVVMSPQVGSVSALDLISVIRGHPAFADLPVLALVGVEDRVEDGLQEAADELLFKPVLTASLLKARVRVWNRRVRVSRSNAELDLATGVLSRGSLLRSLERELGLARRANGTLAVGLIAVSGLDALGNTAAGMPLGDDALRELAQIIGASIRHTDIVGRMGPDHFGLLLPGCNAADGDKRMAVIRARFRTWLSDRDHAGVQIHAGVVDTSKGFADVLVRANRALSLARRAPEVVAPPPEAPPAGG